MSLQHPHDAASESGAGLFIRIYPELHLSPEMRRQGSVKKQIVSFCFLTKNPVVLDFAHEYFLIKGLENPVQQ